MSKRLSAGVWIAGILLIVGCGGQSGANRTSTSAHVEKEVVYEGVAPASETRHVVVARVHRYGWILIDGKGYPLYASESDKPGTDCTKPCSAMWPPFQLTHGNVLDTSPALKNSQFSIEPDPEGGRMVRYAGRLLHNYEGDRTRGVPNGEGLVSYGVHWYLIAPSGALIK